ncbi:MAG: glycine betaine ABC transporter substrate-binding protein [Heliobacteriaceae bacterium]|nr:glycine betaine ABC transporter substrate-binding protein [Heliobacteriaceae bacterium]
MKKHGLKLLALTLALCLGLTLITGCNQNTTDTKTIVVGSKDYNEGIVLGELLAQTLERQTDLQVKRQLNLGATMICWQALKKGEIDLYPEYTGTGLMAILKHDVMKNPDEVYALVQKEFMEKHQAKLMPPFGFNNTYATAVSQKTAESYNLKNTSDLKAYAPNFVFGCEQEFYNRKDGYPGWIDTYGLKFKNVKQMDYSLKYKALGQGEIDVIDAFSTDGELVTYGLTILEDDQNFFPPYHGAAVVRMETLEKYPEVEKAINLLAGKIDDKTMQKLNYQTKEEGKDIPQVVGSFLNEIGI